MMKRIAVIGSPGAGKSTLSVHLSKVLGIKVFHLDQLFWRPGWTETPREEWVRMQEELAKRETWIIDGNYGSTLEIRLNAADTVIFLDFPRMICLIGALKRTIRFRGRTRPDMGKDCPEKFDMEFLKWIWDFPVNERPQILDKIFSKDIIRLRSHYQVSAWLKRSGIG